MSVVTAETGTSSLRISNHGDIASSETNKHQRTKRETLDCSRSLLQSGKEAVADSTQPKTLDNSRSSDPGTTHKQATQPIKSYRKASTMRIAKERSPTLNFSQEPEPQSSIMGMTTNQASIPNKRPAAKYDFNVAKSMKSGTKKNEEEEAHKELKLGSLDVWALGIAVVIGGQYFGWNFSLAAGFGSCYIAMLMIGLAYLCLCLCNAELTSSMPFAGGAYGLARVSLGLWPGFMVGCCESIEYILYTSSSALSLAGMIQSAAGTIPSTIPVYAFIFYVISLVPSILGGRFFWNFTLFLGVISLLLLLMYDFGSLKFINSAVNLPSPGTTGADPDSTPAMFIGGFTAFLTQLPLAGWWYVGVESLNMTASVVSEPRKTIPIGSLACIGTLIATAIFTAAVCPSLPMPSDGTTTATSLAPLNEGYGRMFNVDPATTLAISIPATFATAFGFIFASGRVMICMARSGLFPEFMAITYGKFKTPIVAYLVGQGLGFMLCVLGYYYPVIGANLYNVCILSAFIAYISQLIGYVVFKYKFPRQERKFRSPFGVVGACYGIFVFTLAGISVIGFQPDNHIAIVTMLILLTIYSSMYHLYAKKNQFFSVDEKFIFQVYMNNINSGGKTSINISNQAGGGSVRVSEGDDDDSDDKDNDEENPPSTLSSPPVTTLSITAVDVGQPTIQPYKSDDNCKDQVLDISSSPVSTTFIPATRHTSSVMLHVSVKHDGDVSPTSAQGMTRDNSTECLLFDQKRSYAT